MQGLKPQRAIEPDSFRGISWVPSVTALIPSIMDSSPVSFPSAVAVNYNTSGASRSSVIAY